MNSKQRRAKKRFALRLAENLVGFTSQLIEDLESGKNPEELADKLKKDTEYFKKLINEMK